MITRLTPLALFAVLLTAGTVPVAFGQTESASPAPQTQPAARQQEALAALGRLVEDHYRVSGDLQLEFMRPWTAPAAAGTLTFTLVDAPPALASTLLLRVRVAAGSEDLGETSLLLRAQLLREIWVTRSPVERGAAFNPQELDTRRVDVLRERDTVGVDSASDLVFTRSVPGGRTLTWRDVTRRALVRRGDVIEVSAVDGPLTITMKAMAVENGSAGEIVRVRNLESKKEFSAVVVAESRAQVRF